MRILFLEWKSFGNEDIMEAFEELGYEVKRIPFSNKEVCHDEAIEQELIRSMERYAPDFVFSFNYFPIVSLACRAANVKRLQHMQDFDVFRVSAWKSKTDIAFVGSLYNEKHNFYERLSNNGGIRPYTRGYLGSFYSQNSAPHFTSTTSCLLRLPHRLSHTSLSASPPYPHNQV